MDGRALAQGVETGFTMERCAEPRGYQISSLHRPVSTGGLEGSEV